MAETLQAEATGLYESARDHKRRCAHHRRLAKQNMKSLALLRERAEANGIKIIIHNGEGLKHGQEKLNT